MAIILCLAYGNFNHLFPTRFTESGNSHRFVKESAQIKFLTAINSIKWLDQGQKFKSQSLIVDWIGWQPKTPLQELTTNKTQNLVSCWYKHLWLYFKSQLNWWSTIVTCCRFVSWMSVLSFVGWFVCFLLLLLQRPEKIWRGIGLAVGYIVIWTPGFAKRDWGKWVESRKLLRQCRLGKL